MIDAIEDYVDVAEHVNKIKSIEKVDLTDGDVLIVKVPDNTSKALLDSIVLNLQLILENKEVKVLVLPEDVTLEILSTSNLKDKEIDE